MTSRSATDEVLIAEMLDVSPTVVRFCTALGRLSREWDESDGSILGFVRARVPDLTDSEQRLLAKCISALQAPATSRMVKHYGEHERTGFHRQSKP